MKPVTFLAVAALSLFSVGATAAPASLSGDGILVDGAGMTLYIFDRDRPNVSNCYDGCAQAWPPFIAAESAAAEGDFGLVTRRDGTAQWSYKGMPLYYWAGDQQPGDATGDGVGGVWHILR